LAEDQTIEELISPERWSRIETVFDAALALGPGKRQDFVQQTCVDDEALRRDVESLLAADEVPDDLLNRPASELYMKVMAQETLKDGISPKIALQSPISTGMILDAHWEILEPLDAGGMGEVYKARDLRFDRVVVVKVLKKESQENPWKVKKFGHEGRAQSRIQNANVATVFDQGSLPGGEQYLVMEFINGSTLRQLMNDHRTRDQQIEFSLVAEIMKQVGSGVAAIHEAGLVHRDLKPENIMIKPKTAEVEVKIIDFGIVRVLDTTTMWGQAVGTLFYMSPEQLRGEDPKFTSDIYALAVIAYELLTGRRPFEPQHPAHLVDLQKKGVKLKPSSLRHGLPPRAERVLLKALSYEPNKRQPRARDFTDELARALMVDVPPASGWWSSTKNRLTAAALLAVVLFVALWVLAWVKPRSSTPPPVISTDEKAGRLLTYSLTIARKRDGKMTVATGRETFDTGDEFRLRFTAPRAGALYLFNEGTSGNWHLLFPTRNNHQENPQLAALERVETEGYEFTNRTGSESGKERIWIVWAAGRVPLLDEIIKEAVNTKLTIGNSTQQSALQEFTYQYRMQSSAQIFSIDEQSQVTLSGRGDIFVYLLELESKDWK
jgi:serine/threonine protein kinase